MKTLLLMRHAKSSWKNSTLADRQRPLNTRGRRDAPRMGELLNQENLVPEVILCSPARRAQETAAGVLESLQFDGEVITHKALYGSGLEIIHTPLSLLANQFAKAMIVGHNPEMEDFIEQACGKRERMTTASIAVIELPIEAWSQLNDDTEGHLLHLWRPRELD